MREREMRERERERKRESGERGGGGGGREKERQRERESNIFDTLVPTQYCTMSDAALKSIVQSVSFVVEMMSESCSRER